MDRTTSLREPFPRSTIVTDPSGSTVLSSFGCPSSAVITLVPSGDQTTLSGQTPVLNLFSSEPVSASTKTTKPF